MAHDGTYVGVISGTVRLSDGQECILMCIRDDRDAHSIVLRTETARRVAAQLVLLADALDHNPLSSDEK